VADSTQGDPSLAVLKQAFATATQHASMAMCQWTRGSVSLELDRLHTAPLEEAMGLFTDCMDLMVMIVLAVKGTDASQLILSFDESRGRQLAANLLQREVPADAEWTELEKSALMETGNILASAYLNELTRLAGRQLLPAPPVFVQDYGTSVLEQALMVQACVSDEVMISSTRFVFDAKAVDWNVLFLPDAALSQTIQDAIFFRV